MTEVGLPTLPGRGRLEFADKLASRGGNPVSGLGSGVGDWGEGSF